MAVLGIGFAGSASEGSAAMAAILRDGPGLLVDDLDGAVGAARAAGVEVDGVQDTGRERYAHLLAPDAHLDELIERR